MDGGHPPPGGPVASANQRAQEIGLPITPHHLEVARLFAYDRTFQVPKYQRYYAWGDEQVEDFISDIERCRFERAAGRTRPHFLGGLVTVAAPVAGSNRQNVEVIDGQQRLTTITMLVAQLRRRMRELLASVDRTAPDAPHEFLKKREDQLRGYEWFEDSVSLRTIEVPRLTLSKPDRTFFAEMLAWRDPAVRRESHRLLKAAFTKIDLYLQELVAEGTDVGKAECLAQIADVLSHDWTVIHMATDSRPEAYMLFQVLNDRGTGLTEGVLLRAATLDALERGGSDAQLAQTEDAWDRMLELPSERVEEDLRWIYASHEGERPGKTTLFDQFLTKRFPQQRTTLLDAEDATSLAEAVQALETDFQRIERMRAGDWPYAPIHPDITLFDRERLELLVVHLKFEICMPLLVSAARLDQMEFARIVHLLERFMFRYKTIVGARVEPAMKAFYQHAVAIRSAPSTYRVASLEADLRQLVARYADDTRFISRLREHSYQPAGGNKPLKYLLLTLDHYVAWNDRGGTGRPLADKSWIDDFRHATLEHVHAQSPGAPNPALDPVVNALGNLAVLNPRDNDAAGNRPFAQKRLILARSSSPLNARIGQEQAWELAQVEARRDYIEDLARKVFSI